MTTTTTQLTGYFVTRHYRSFGGTTSMPIDIESAEFGSESDAMAYAGAQNSDQIICCVHRRADGKRNTWLTPIGWY